MISSANGGIRIGLLCAVTTTPRGFDSQSPYTREERVGGILEKVREKRSRSLCHDSLLSALCGLSFHAKKRPHVLQDRDIRNQPPPWQSLPAGLRRLDQFGQSSYSCSLSPSCLRLSSVQDDHFGRIQRSCLWRLEVRDTR